MYTAILSESDSKVHCTYLLKPITFAIYRAAYLRSDFGIYIDEFLMTVDRGSGMNQACTDSILAYPTRIKHLDTRWGSFSLSFSRSSLFFIVTLALCFQNASYPPPLSFVQLPQLQLYYTFCPPRISSFDKRFIWFPPSPLRLVSTSQSYTESFLSSSSRSAKRNRSLLKVPTPSFERLPSKIQENCLKWMLGRPHWICRLKRLKLRNEKWKMCWMKKAGEANRTHV